jgi:hypothetical protein
MKRSLACSPAPANSAGSGMASRSPAAGSLGRWQVADRLVAREDLDIGRHMVALGSNGDLQRANSHVASRRDSSAIRLVDRGPGR